MNKLQQLNQSLLTLKAKISKFKEQKNQQLTKTTLKLNEANHKLELSLKENSENEKVLEQLLKEMGELEESL